MQPPFIACVYIHGARFAAGRHILGGRRIARHGRGIAQHRREHIAALAIHRYLRPAALNGMHRDRRAVVKQPQGIAGFAHGLAQMQPPFIACIYIHGARFAASSGRGFILCRRFWNQHVGLHIPVFAVYAHLRPAVSDNLDRNRRAVLVAAQRGAAFSGAFA